MFLYITAVLVIFMWCRMFISRAYRMAGAFGCTCSRLTKM